MNDNDLVTLETFQHIQEARMALDFLVSNGIKAVLADEHVASTHFFLGNAIGGIKLKVLRKDAETAQKLFLERHLDAMPEVDRTGFEVEDAHFEEEEEDPKPVVKPEDLLTHRELFANHAFYGSLAGILACPIQLWVFVLLIRILVSKERLQKPYRIRVLIAACVNLPFMYFFGRFIFMVICKEVMSPNPSDFSLVR